MRKILVVAWREYQAAVRTRAFLLGLLLMPVMMGAGIGLQFLLHNIRDTQEKRFAVVDRSGDLLWGQLERAVQEHNAHLIDADTGQQVRPALVLERVAASSDAGRQQQRFELSERVRRGELVGFLDIGPEVFTTKALPPSENGSVRYHTSRPTELEFPRLAERTINQAVQEQRAAQRHTDLAELRAIVQPVPLQSHGLLRRDAATDSIQDSSEQARFAPIIVPGVLSLLIVMIVLMGATPMMQGVVEEKMQRIAEVLLGSIRPFPLLLGKLLGMTAVSLTMGSFYLSGLWISAQRWGFGEFLTPGLVIWFVVFQTLACLMYGSLFIAVGAACSDMKETQNLLWPILMLTCLPLFVLGHVLQEPNGPVAITLSYFPFATPMLMITRMSIPPGVAWWEPFLGVFVVLLTSATCIWIASRIFRVGMLMQGQGARLGEIMRWVLRG